MLLHHVGADLLAVQLHLVRHVRLGCEGVGEHDPATNLDKCLVDIFFVLMVVAIIIKKT